MAFISEIHYRSGDIAATQSEFIEITLAPGEDPADFVLSFYDTNDNIAGYVSATGVSGGEVTLSSLTGVPDPENPGYTIYTITSTEPDGRLINGGNGNNGIEANSVALTNTATSTVIDAYSVNVNPSTTLNGGAADGATTTSTSAAGSLQSLQWDSNGTESSAPLTPSNSEIACFVSNTRIQTPGGCIAVDALSCGDLVLNTDGVAHPVRWIGSRRVSVAELRAYPKLRPVRITAGALGAFSPSADLLVSRQHRMLMRSKIAERMFGVDEVLISAIKLTALPGVFVEPLQTEVEYFHLLFDDHEIILAEGAATESLHTGPQALETLPDEAIEEIKLLFPDRFQPHNLAQPSRCVPKGAQQRRFVDRHLKNNKHVYQAAQSG